MGAEVLSPDHLPEVVDQFGELEVFVFLSREEVAAEPEDLSAFRKEDVVLPNQLKILEGTFKVFTDILKDVVWMVRRQTYKEAAGCEQLDGDSHPPVVFPAGQPVPPLLSPAALLVVRQEVVCDGHHLPEYLHTMQKFPLKPPSWPSLPFGPYLIVRRIRTTESRMDHPEHDRNNGQGVFPFAHGQLVLNIFVFPSSRDMSQPWWWATLRPRRK